MAVKMINGEIIEHHLQKNVIHKTQKGVPHINIAIETSILYEWWDGPYEGELCPGLFNDYKKGRVGPRD